MYLSTSFLLLPMALLGIHLVLGQWIIPHLKQRPIADDFGQSGRDLTVSLLTTLNDFIRLATATYGLFIVVVLVLHLAAGVSGAEYVRHFIRWASESHEKLDSFKGLQQAGLIFGGVALIILVYRRQRRFYRERYLEQLQQTIADLDAGRLQYRPLPPSEEMKAIEEQLTKVDAELSKLHKQAQKPDPAQRQAIGMLEKVQQRLRQELYLRSVAQQLKARETATLPATSLQESLLLFFSSKGLFSVFEKLGGVLSKAVGALALVSLITLQAHQASEYASDSLSRQSVRQDLEYARSRFANTMAQNHGAVELTAEDERFLDAFAADFEVGLANSLSSTQEDSSAFAVQSMLVRTEILRRYVQASEARRPNNDYGLVEPQPSDQTDAAEVVTDPATSSTSTNSATSSGPLPQDVFRFSRGYYSSHRATTQPGPRPSPEPQAAYATKVPHTSVGKAFRTEMRTAAATAPDWWAGMKTKARAYGATFFEPVELKEVTNLLFVDGLGEWASNALFGESDAVISAGRGVLGKEMQEKLIFEHLNRLAGPEPYEAALRELMRQSPDVVFSSPTYARSATKWLATVPPKLELALTTHPPIIRETRVLPDAADVVQQLDKLNPTGWPPNYKPLKTYDDLFPGQLGADTKTPAGKAAAEAYASYLQKIKEAVDRGVITEQQARELRQTLAEAVDASGHAGRKNFTRARSYTQLGSSNLIGGVLIGNGPQQEAKGTVSFTNLAWEDLGGEMKLTLETANGNSVPLGAYPKTIIEQALSYAADARPTTVTILNVPPAAHQKVFLHPALLNSRLGNDAIRLVATAATGELWGCNLPPRACERRANGGPSWAVTPITFKIFSCFFGKLTTPCMVFN